MSIWEILGKILIYTIVAPVLACVAAVWSALIMTIAVLLAPIVCVVTIFFKEPYKAFAWFYEKTLWLASVPFTWLQKLVK